jgi:isocitrate dehydrogenase (NAD+)
VKDIFDHVNAPIEWEQYDVSGMSSAGEALFKQAMESLKRNRVGLKGDYFPIQYTQNSFEVKEFFSPPYHSLDTFPGM